MLGSVVVHLEGQACAGVHRDSLHLPAAAFRDSGVGTPGTVDLAMGFALRTAISLQLLHHGLDVLGFGPVRD